MDGIIDAIYRGLRFFIDKIIGYTAAIVMLGATLLALVEIFRRYYFGVTFNWGQDAVVHFIIAAIFLFFAVTQARRSHLSVSFVLDLLKKRGHEKVVQMTRIFNSCFTIGLCSAFAWWGYPSVVRMFATQRTTQSLDFVLWPFQLCLLIGFTLMALVAVFQLYQDVCAVCGKTVFPWAESEEGIDI
jgi:TRAP-type C4-dicarboxylate transport system permease small subunit